MKYNSKVIGMCMVAMGLLSGCATMTPTVQSKSQYVIYQIDMPEGVSPSQVAQAVKTSLQRHVNSIQISENVPPYPLPETAPRFQVGNPFGPALSALAGPSAMTQVATCEGALVYARANMDSMSGYGETSTFTVCLWQYQGGYRLDTHVVFVEKSGGFSPEALGAALAKKVVGNSGQLIPRTINSIVSEVEKTGATVSQVDAWP
ncbi:hypothetical protein CO612_08550 [Lysobacteraceae bacterium NML71-0210]|nr:hypothetical protein CO612_08550 [Xanthomonadaceae bacterium NML71-0210]